MTQLILVTPKRKIFQLRAPDNLVRVVNKEGNFTIVVGQEQTETLVNLLLSTRQLVWKDKKGETVLVGDLQDELNEELLSKLCTWGQLLT